MAKTLWEIEDAHGLLTIYDDGTVQAEANDGYLTHLVHTFEAKALVNALRKGMATIEKEATGRSQPS